MHLVEGKTYRKSKCDCHSTYVNAFYALQERLTDEFQQLQKQRKEGAAALLKLAAEKKTKHKLLEAFRSAHFVLNFDLQRIRRGHSSNKASA